MDRTPRKNSVNADADDMETADLLTERVGQHEQNVWMLRALLAK